MNCGYCRDCKWWEKHNYQGAIHPELGTCKLTEPVRLPGRPPRIHSKAFAEGHGYSALSTEPDFGCIQFEAKA